MNRDRITAAIREVDEALDRLAELAGDDDLHATIASTRLRVTMRAAGVSACGRASVEDDSDWRPCRRVEIGEAGECMDCGMLAVAGLRRMECGAELCISCMIRHAHVIRREADHG